MCRKIFENRKGTDCSKIVHVLRTRKWLAVNKGIRFILLDNKTVRNNKNQRKSGGCSKSNIETIDVPTWFIISCSRISRQKSDCPRWQYLCGLALRRSRSRPPDQGSRCVDAVRPWCLRGAPPQLAPLRKGLAQDFCSWSWSEGWACPEGHTLACLQRANSQTPTIKYHAETGPVNARSVPCAQENSTCHIWIWSDEIKIPEAVIIVFKIFYKELTLGPGNGDRNTGPKTTRGADKITTPGSYSGKYGIWNIQPA